MATSGEHDQLRQWIVKKLDGNPCCKEADTFLKLLLERSTSKQTKKDHEQAEKWLFWARHESQLRCVIAGVPIGVLPEGIEGELIDVKVFSKGPDDAIYDNNDLIRRKVARGNCFLHLTSGPDPGVSCVLQAMKKFTGGLGDDDDRESGDSFVWQKYFTKPLDDTSVVIATRKANGEAAHLSCRLIGGEYVLCGGSKNVHMLFRRKEDIKKYGEPRFRIAREVCATIMDSIDKMKSEEKERLLRFLVVSQYTGVFEILAPDHQHVEDLSYLTGPELHFITWTRSDLDPSGEDVAAVPPHIGIEIARSLGLQTVKYDRVSTANLDRRMKEIRQGYQFEGEVLYFLDSQGVVMGLLKKKTIWYIMCRAIREKLRAACVSLSKYKEKFTVKKVLKKVERRMREIQKWLALDDEIINFWNILGNKFLRWTLQKFEEGSITMEEVADKFPVIWKSFLQSTQESDDYVLLKKKETEGADNCSHTEHDGILRTDESSETNVDSDVSERCEKNRESVNDSDQPSAVVGVDNSSNPIGPTDDACKTLKQSSENDIESKMAATELDKCEDSPH